MDSMMNVSDSESESNSEMDCEMDCELDNNIYEYLDFNLVERYSVNSSEISDELVTVQCYNNGTSWICPNPLNLSFCDYVFSWYMSTHGVKLKTCTVHIEDISKMYKFEN